MARMLKMCVVNAEFVDELGKMVGSQAEIMTRVGISWNTWNKLVDGQPIRLTVGERLRSRVLDDLDAMPGLKEKFSPDGEEDKPDLRALERAFFKPVTLRREASQQRV